MAPGVGKRKKPTTITFGRAPPASGATPAVGSSASSSTGGVLREKTSIRLDGVARQQRSIVPVALGKQHPKVHPDVARPLAPIYEPYSAADHGGDEDYEDYDDEGGRDLRASDHPLQQWAEDHRETYLAEVLRHEGRGNYAGGACSRCTIHPQGEADHRCITCLSSGELLCAGCIVAAHRYLPFHKIQRWDGAKFQRVALKSLGLRIQLGHWHGSETDRICPLPLTAPNDDFVIVDNSGVHPVHLDYCNCGLGGHPMVQLLCFYDDIICSQTDNLHYKKDKDRYHEFLRMTRQWRNVQMLKRAGRGHDLAGIAGTRAGECALLCPACPQPGKNLPPGWKDAPDKKQFLYALFLALDANFRLKRKDVSSEEKDPGLGNGLAFYGKVEAYMHHVKKHWHQKQDRSHCVAHDAVDKPDREARRTASSGVGAVDCTRHNMKRPRAVGDLQLRECYINMDYMFFYSIAGTELLRFFVSYDIACQWHLNIWSRMQKYQDATLTLDGRGKFMTFLVPKFHLPAHIEACNLKFSFNLTRNVGQTDGEAPERGWADANPLARSMKEMGPGFRRDTIDDHFNDWNHKKIIALGYTLHRKVEKAVPEMVKTREALRDMNESVGPEPVKKWVGMAEKWEADISAPNPFETIRKDQHVAKVRAELAAEAAERERLGREDEGAVKGDMHITELIAMGLQLEEQQRVLAFDVAATGLHPTDGQCRAMIERTSKLRRKIFAWIEVQQKFFPALANIRACEDEARARVLDGQPIPGVPVSSIALWLPSAIAGAAVPDARELVIKKSIFKHEYRLRVGQASEMLHEIRRLLLVRTHLYKLKDTHSRGVRANMRSGDKIAALNEQIKRAAAVYRAAHGSLERLGGELKRDEWSWTLQPLWEDDVWGLPQSRFHDPERKKRKRARKAKKVERPLSWIWPGDDDVAMNEAVRIEWAKTRARSMRWAEEVDLLEEEMHHVSAFLRWRSEWWRERMDQRGLLAGPQLEGETVYALRQAGLGRPYPAGGREGKLGDDAVGSDEEDESDAEDSGEDEPIPALPVRPVKPAYVDEVLVM
ncbi:CxC2 domain-containing protein [Mycena venus]|uniref:CxC2 domain-containing protein n=1 Tax=Mycena venus TaxID=2733690 RepID=A0A8H6YHF8_9AGAR|nr:CxC2 domain-containing protein [Mycena venus]